MKKRKWHRNGKQGSKEKKKSRIVLLLLMAAVGVVLCKKILIDRPLEKENGEAIEVSTDGNFIKWVDFNVTCEAMGKAYELDVASYKDEVHVDWIELLAYVGARHGGQFDKSCVSELQETADKLQAKETTIAKLTKDMEYYDYYEEAYRAVLGGMVGEFSLEVPVENNVTGENTETSVSGQTEVQQTKEWRDFYGLKAFSPIAKGFEYSHYDDFGSARSYGYSRPHLGHDMMGQIGTPI
ncbi:MAG: hypothetical protein J6B68_04165 [Lachnospiraceae bacterium]|nr:hypothetical protein [Lachnospiraceae bacterium]